MDNLLSHLKALKQLSFEDNNFPEAILMNIVLQSINDESRETFEMTVEHDI